MERTTRTSALLLFLVIGASPMATPAQQALAWRRHGPPPADANHAMCTNVNGAGVVMFTSSGETWVHDGTAWRLQTLAVAPIPRSKATLTFDLNRNVAVLFGGSFNSQLLQDTWEWDGQRWREVHPAGPLPPSRNQHAAAFDASRGKVVLFGGHGGNVLLNDTWEWDGTSWTSFAGNAPAARYLHAMASDPTGVVVLYGGWSGGAFGDTWVRSGSTWSQRTPIVSPPPLRAHAMVLHAISREVLMIGGSVAWRWNGTAWAQAQPNTVVGIDGAQLAYDFTRATTLAFGGANSAALNRTSEWSSAGWIHPTYAPQPRQAMAAGFDRLANQVVLHGGVNGSGSVRFTDTWTWDGRDWTPVPTPSPFARIRHSLDWEPNTNRLVMFGGDSSTGDTSTTYAWNRSTRSWSTLTPAASPPLRSGHASLSIDTPVLRGVLIYGGTGNGTPRTDLWHFDGNSWHQLPTQGAPVVAGGKMALEPSETSLILTAGGTTVWRLDLGSLAWTQLFSPTAPTAQSGVAMLHDPVRNRVLLTGGFANSSTMQEAWEWDGLSTTWRALATPPFARGSHAMCEGPNAELLVFGGAMWGVDVFDTMWTVAPFAAATATSHGSGCGVTPATAPLLTCTRLPYIANTLELRASRLPIGPVQGHLVFDVTVRAPVTLCSGCQILVHGFGSQPMQIAFGSGALQIPIPNVPALVGGSFAVQGAFVHASYPCLPGVGVGLSNALSLAVGSY